MVKEIHAHCKKYTDTKNHEEESRSYLSFHNSCWHMDSGLTYRNMCINVRSQCRPPSFQKWDPYYANSVIYWYFKKTYIKAWHIQKNMHKTWSLWLDKYSQINTQIKKKKKCKILHQVVCYPQPGAMLALHHSNFTLCAPERNI